MLARPIQNSKFGLAANTNLVFICSNANVWRRNQARLLLSIERYEEVCYFDQTEVEWAEAGGGVVVGGRGSRRDGGGGSKRDGDGCWWWWR